MTEIKEKSVQSLISYIQNYRRKAVVMREIHSTLAEKCRRYDLWFTFMMLALVSATTFFSFSKINLIEGTWLDIGIPIFNIVVFLVFFASLLNLVFRWKENHTLHFQGVVRLTHFILWVDQELTLAKKFDPILITKVCERYQSIIDILPPNDNKAYIAAKKSLSVKSNVAISISRKEIYLNGFINKIKSFVFRKGENSNSEFLKNIISASPRLFPVLKCMRETDERLWLGGGAIRNYVWDTLTGRTTPTDDLDVVYFDLKTASKEYDSMLEAKLIANSDSSLNWSVKNQARMFRNESDAQVNDLFSAIANWPETATAIIVRLKDDNTLDVIAPHGVTDLLSLTLRPTNLSQLHPEVFESRLREKNWLALWPELKVVNLHNKSLSL